MYKLVVVGGALRGKEFILEKGENIIGRSEECSIPLEVDGISKKHLSITVTDDVAYLKDLGSSNGTFVNEKMVKSKTVKNGDKLAIPDVIFQLVYVKEKKILIKKEVAHAEDEEERFLKGGSPPDNPIGKAVHAFKYKLMPVIYGINEEYEWKILLAIFMVVFSVLNITFTITPVLRDSKKILLQEIAKRGAHYSEEISRINASALEKRRLDQVDTKFLDEERDIASYELFDLEGRIVRPLEKLNEYSNDDFSVRTRDWAIKTRDQGKLVKREILSNGEIGIGRKIMAYNARLGVQEPVGVIAIRFAPQSLAVEATKSSKAYLESLMTSFLICALIYGILYFLTLRPIEELNFNVEEALRGKKKSIESRFLMSELRVLRGNLNAMIQRIRELQNDSEDEFQELESDEGYVWTLKEFLKGAGVPTLVLNSEKNVSSLNIEAEDLTGIRESSAEGMNILDVSREKGFAATVIDLCDQSASEEGSCKEGQYELQGRPYRLYANSLMGKDNFAKAFYITFVMDEE